MRYGMRCVASSRAVASPAAPAPTMTTGSAIVDGAAPLAVQLEHGPAFLTQHAAVELDAASTQIVVRRVEDRTLVEIDAVRIFARRAPHDLPHAAPQHRAQTHRARLTRRVQ